MKKLLLIFITATLLSAFTSACGKNTNVTDNTNTETIATEETTADNSFLTGAWFVENVSKDGQEVSEADFFKGTFSLYFNDKGECTMAIDDKRAVLKWELNDAGVILTGDDTYELKFTDENKNKMHWELYGADVTLYKYEEDN